MRAAVSLGSAHLPRHSDRNGGIMSHLTLPNLGANGAARSVGDRTVTWEENLMGGGLNKSEEYFLRDSILSCTCG
jgi:hypothetical protein